MRYLLLSVFLFIIFSSILPTHSLAINPTPNLTNFCHIPYGSVVNIDKIINASYPPNQTYRNIVKKDFTQATFFAHPWFTHNDSPTSYEWSKVDQTVAWLTSNNLTPKLHAIVWHNKNRVGVPDDDNLDWYETLPSNQDRQIALKQHVQTTIWHFQGDVNMFDLVNHAMTHGLPENYMLTGWNRRTAIVNIFNWAVEANPDATFVINEAINDLSTAKRYRDFINDLIQNGARVDAIGIKEHIGECHGTLSEEKFNNPNFTQQKLDILAQTGLPIHITEFDISFTHVSCREAQEANLIDPDQPFNISGKTYPNWYQYQAHAYSFLMDVYTSHPSVDNITFWGFTDRAHWRKGAGFYDVEYQPKPSYSAIQPYITYNYCNSPTSTPTPLSTITTTPSETPTPTPKIIPNDLDHDQDVDYLDFHLLTSPTNFKLFDVSQLFLLFNNQ